MESNNMAVMRTYEMKQHEQGPPFSLTERLVKYLKTMHILRNWETAWCMSELF
jgi:hypothetical protein